MFNSARIKVQWAEHHIRNLGETFRDFTKTNPTTINFKKNPGGTDGMLEVKVGEILPAEISLMVADIVHNLRTSLELANWELRGLDGGVQNHYTTLPIGNDRKHFESRCDGISATSKDLPTFFKTLEIFPRGKGATICDLHDLNNEYKHMIMPIVGQSIRFNPAIYTREASTENAQDSPEMFFANEGNFQWKPVVPTIKEFTISVREMITQFELFVRTPMGRD